MSHPHPRPGPDGETLSTDVAVLGPGSEPGTAAPEHTVLVVSGTHGVEGFCGSALQRHWLATRSDERPDDVRIVMLHAINPFGFAWVRRVNEDNVDLNRNFVEPYVTGEGQPPTNPAYDELADLLVPSSWTPAEQERTTTALLQVATERGFGYLQAAVSGGQYSHPLGLFYGGAGPVWSHHTLRSILADVVAGSPRTTIIDLHTGLGPWGHGELIVHDSAGSPGYERAGARWGEVRSMTDGESVSAALSGDWLAAVEWMLPATEVTSAALEFGTVDTVTVLQALRADAWLHGHGDPLGPHADEVRAQVRAAFADDDPAWIRPVRQRFEDVFAQALV